MSKLVKHLIDAMTPNRRAGRIPTVTACPYCGVQLSQTEHRKHSAACATDSRKTPPRAAEFAQDPGGGYNRDGTFPQT